MEEKLKVMKKKLIRYWEKKSIITDKRLLEAFRKVPREDFVLEDFKESAYIDNAMPIIEGQTISQPTTVMIMSQALELKEGDKVLEVGAGCGYQAAILSEMVGNKGKVYTTDIIPALVDFAKKNLKNYKNVKIVNADGSKGFSKNAPYSKIIVTAACPKVPEPLVEQLKENGILVAPVGSKFDQEMLKITKNKDGLKTESLGYFMFVPLKGEYGF